MQAPSPHRLGYALDAERCDLLAIEPVEKRSMHRVGEQDLTRSRGVGQSCSEIHRLARDRVRAVSNAAGATCHHVATSDAKVHHHLPARLLRKSWHRVANSESGTVCMGAFLLGAAGLLKGRRATTHWAFVDLLPLVGTTYEKSRVVHDGNVFTCGGVTSGIDFAFRIVAELAGPEAAQAIQLGIEYDPSPPFDAGHPDKASAAAMALMVQRNAVAHEGLRQRLENLAILGKA